MEIYVSLNVFLCQHTPGPNFIIKDLPSVLILIIADQILSDCLFLKIQLMFM